MLFAQFFLNEQVATFRVTCKMLYLQLNVFLDLAANGFCVPKHLDLEETDESGEKMGEGGMGLAEGEGTTDVSDRIESEDQLEDAKLPNQEQEKQEDKTCKEEEKGIDMSEDFDSKLQDLEKSDEDEEQSNDEEEENDDMDKEMAETGEEAEQLDKEIWGDDEEEESDDDNQQPKNEDEKEGIGEQTGEEELTAKNDKDRKKQRDKDTDRKNQQENRKEEDKKEINELNEPETNEDQIDPYYKPQPETEPEPFESPEDLDVDEDDIEDGGETQEENPFDEMKDEMDSKSPPRTEDVTPDEEVENDPVDESAEDDKENDENLDKDEQDTIDELETNKENEQEKNGQTTEIEEEKEDQKETEEEKAVPSTNSATQQTDAAQPIEEMEGSRDAVAQEQSDKNQSQQDALTENTDENSNNDNGCGQSQSVQQESGHSESSKQEMVSASQRNTMQQKKRSKPNKSNEDHTLLDRYEPLSKKQKTLYTQEEMSRNENEEEDDLGSNSNEIEMVQHIHKDSQKFDDYTLDAATEDQLKKQAANKDKETDNLDDTKAEEGIGEDIEMEEPTESERQMVETPRVCKEKESSLHVMECSSEHNDLISNYVQNGHSKLEEILGKWLQMPSTENAIAAWNGLCSITDTAARDLSEKLRLVLEPTQASRLKGDYKTGKRINMRKIISYIASQFRKDKIWLKRTKPSKRDYQVVIAIDDSHSMSYNISSKMTLESLSLISKAMTYLEVGQVGIISFGDEVKLLHPLGETFTEQSGARYFHLYFINLDT
jgi:midasin